MNEIAQNIEPAKGHGMDTAVAGTGDYRLSDKLVLLSDNTSIAAESISMLLSQLLSQHVQDYRRAIAFCSPTADTGCTFMAANVAVGMARAGVRTLLVDGNLRDPAIHEYIEPAQDRGGLLQCLEHDDIEISDVVHGEVIPNLSVLYSGGTSSVSGLLASSRFKALIATCMRDFDLTIMDTPPANRSSDALRLGNILRYTLIVVRKDKSYLSDVRKLVSDLQANRAQVVGTYLNDF